MRCGIPEKPASPALFRICASPLGLRVRLRTLDSGFEGRQRGPYDSTEPVSGHPGAVQWREHAMAVAGSVRSSAKEEADPASWRKLRDPTRRAP